VSDQDINRIWFTSSSVSLIHPYILAKFPNVEEVRVQSSDLNLNQPIENCQYIKRIFLEFSGITEISSNLFSNCKKLEKIEIESDSLRDLPDDIFQNLPSLKELVLNGKNLKLRESHFESLKAMSFLTVYSIDLSQAKPSFFKSLNITSFTYSGSGYYYRFPIESINSHETIEVLGIRDINMKQLPVNLVQTLRSLNKLRVLNLSGNSITSVEAFVDLPSVEWLNLASNEIEEIPAHAFKGCPRLSNLLLSYNPIKVLRGDEFDQLSGLVTLNLDNIKITSIEPTTFQHLTALETLNLSYLSKLNNHIISKELVKNFTNLRSLNLRNNNIHAIEPGAFDNNHKLTYLNLQNNRCVDRKFVAPDNETLNMVLEKEGLQRCFDNFAKLSKL
jgi:Leucine-rich repeat (LRR) protein